MIVYGGWRKDVVEDRLFWSSPREIVLRRCLFFFVVVSVGGISRRVGRRRGPWRYSRPPSGLASYLWGRRVIVRPWDRPRPCRLHLFLDEIWLLMLIFAFKRSVLRYDREKLLYRRAWRAQSTRDLEHGRLLFSMLLISWTGSCLKFWLGILKK